MVVKSPYIPEMDTNGYLKIPCKFWQNYIPFQRLAAICGFPPRYSPMFQASTKANKGKLVGGWTTHLKNMLVKMEIFPK